MPSIRIQKQGGSWTAAYHRAATAEGVLALFGTYVLPTPWRDTVPAAEVVAELARLNPDHEIIEAELGQ